MLSRPCAIDPDYCNVRMISINDFPESAMSNGEIFVAWVQLCEIIGRIGKAIAQGKMYTLDNAPAKDLVTWAQNLEAHLQLPFSRDRTTGFKRDVHLLHLPYLATVILLHLQKGTDKLPRTSATALVAASCVARIFEDFMARTTLRFVPGQAGWYISIALLALQYARQIDQLSLHANADIKTLRTALNQMAHRWHSSKMFSRGFDKIFDARSAVDLAPGSLPRQSGASGSKDAPANLRTSLASSLEDVTSNDTADWTSCFPYVTTETSPLIAVLLEKKLEIPVIDWNASQFTYLLDYLDDVDFTMLDTDLNL
jgi:hypothetical protein